MGKEKKFKQDTDNKLDLAELEADLLQYLFTAACRDWYVFFEKEEGHSSSKQCLCPTWLPILVAPSQVLFLWYAQYQSTE